MEDIFASSFDLNQDDREQHSQQKQPSQDDQRENSPSFQREITLFNTSKNRFLNFLEEIGQHKDTPIRKDVLAYCKIYKKSKQPLQPILNSLFILSRLENRIQKMIKTKRIKKNWGDDDMKLFIWIVSKYADWKQFQEIEKSFVDIDWTFIATLIPAVTPESCMFKWLSIKKNTLAYHSWTEEESLLLRKIVERRCQKELNHSSDIKEWKQISQELYCSYQSETKCYRNAKQCREHWACFLSPRLKRGPWNLEEDVKLLRYIKNNKGNKKWSEIARCFEGRTENALKNRFTLLMEKQRKSCRNRYRTEMELIQNFLDKCYLDEITGTLPKKLDGSENDQENEQNEHFCLQKKYQIKCQTSNSYQQQGKSAIRIQKIDLMFFDNNCEMNWKNLQPGVIEDGTFRPKQSLFPGLKNDSGEKIHDWSINEMYRSRYEFVDMDDRDQSLDIHFGDM